MFQYVKVVGADLASSIWNQITQIYSYHPGLIAIELIKKMLSKGDNFHTSSDKSRLNCGLKKKIFLFCGSTFKVS